MEKINNVESVLEQAFEFGTFGTAQYKSFKCQQLVTTEGDLSQNLSGTVTYTDHGTENSKALHVKVINENCSYAFKHLAFLSEISIRRRIIPYLEKYSQISSHFARFYYGAVSSTTENDDAVIILESLENVQPSQQFWDRSQLFEAMEFLGKFHSASYIAKVKDPNVFFPQLRRLHEINFAQNESITLSNKLSNLYQFNRTLKEFVKSTLSSRPEPESVICVGLLSGAKALFQNDKENRVSIKITELFGTRYAQPAFDLMNVLYLCVDQEIRDKHWNEALKLYYDTLTKGADKYAPQFAQIQQDFKTYSLIAYITASVVLPNYFDSEKLKEILNDIEEDILNKNTEE